MNEKSLSEILSMSGYASYVWTAFGVVLLALCLLFVVSRHRLKNALITNEKLLSERAQ